MEDSLYLSYRYYRSDLEVNKIALGTKNELAPAGGGVAYIASSYVPFQGRINSTTALVRK